VEGDFSSQKIKTKMVGSILVIIESTASASI
jgi:hypothetical protein